MASSACKQLRSLFDKMFKYDKDPTDIVCVEKETKPAVDIIIHAVNAAKARATEPTKIIDMSRDLLLAHAVADKYWHALVVWLAVGESER